MCAQAAQVLHQEPGCTLLLHTKVSAVLGHTAASCPASSVCAVAVPAAVTPVSSMVAQFACSAQSGAAVHASRTLWRSVVG